VWSVVVACITLGSQVQSTSSSELRQQSRNCSHGTLADDNFTCVCFEDWRHAGITDTVSFLQGSCDQYLCESNELCELHLGIQGARCPVPKWNCYCGWSYALSNWGRGFENSKGKCMGLMYTFSAWITYSVESFMSTVWRLILLLALILLPFGRKRANCDHHRPTMWTGLRRFIGRASVCNGECVLRTEYTTDSFMDDVAWSLFVLEVGLWLYAAGAIVWLLLLTVWSVLLWSCVIIMLLFAGLAALFSAGCGDDCGSCMGCCDDLSCCDPCCCCPPAGVAGEAGFLPSDMLFYSGPHSGIFTLPGQMDTLGTRGFEGSGSTVQRLLCRPIAWLIYVCPSAPENAWGGLLGYFVLGTHTLTPPEGLYAGGNCVTEFLGMSWRRRSDLHWNHQWREQVYQFLLGEDELGTRSAHTGNERSVYMREDGSRQTVLALGRTAKALFVNRTFDLEADRCVLSSFEDYQQNNCWICTESREEWDLWLSCKHLFCKDCSATMLKRGMPCPLCRVASSTVLRGRAIQAAPGSISTPLLHGVSTPPEQNGHTVPVQASTETSGQVARQRVEMEVMQRAEAMRMADVETPSTTAEETEREGSLAMEVARRASAAAARAENLEARSKERRAAAVEEQRRVEAAQLQRMRAEEAAAAEEAAVAAASFSAAHSSSAAVAAGAPPDEDPHVGAEADADAGVEAEGEAESEVEAKAEAQEEAEAGTVGEVDAEAEAEARKREAAEDEEEARRAEAEEELSRRLAASLEAGRRRAAQEGEARSAARQAAYAELRSEVGHVAAHQEPRRPPIMQHAGFEEEHFMSAVMETAFRAELDLVPQRPAPTEVTGASSASGDPFVVASDEVMQALRVGAEFAHTADGPVIEVSDNPADPTEEGLSPQTRHGSATDDSATAAPWHLMPSVGTWHCSLPLVCDGPSPLSSMETPLLGSTVGSEPQAQEARCDDLSDVLRNSLRARKADGTLEELLDQASKL